MNERGTEPAAPAGRRGRARQQLLGAAARRFYADGLAATGIDTITAEAGVAKMSLYNNFSSKADLIRAYLEARHEEWLTLYRRRLELAAGPRERVLAVFDAYTDHAAQAYEHGFRGCGLLNAADDHAVSCVRFIEDELFRWARTIDANLDLRRLLLDRDAALESRLATVEALLAGHLEDLLPGRPGQARAMAEHLAFLLEGAMARAGLEGDDVRLEHGRRIASGLLEAL